MTDRLAITSKGGYSSHVRRVVVDMYCGEDVDYIETTVIEPDKQIPGRPQHINYFGGAVRKGVEEYMDEIIVKASKKDFE